MEEIVKKRYNCDLCRIDEYNPRVTESVTGFNLDGGGHWWVCEEHQNDEMFRDRPKRSKS
jgi:hypothetical protein